MKSAAASFSAFFHDVLDFLPPGIVPIFATGFICDRAYLRPFLQEVIGSIIMIVFTFSAGKWIGQESLRLAWTSHFFGVIAADYVGGGPMVNPAMSVAFWSLGKISYTEAYVRIAGQMGGGLVAFPLFHAVSNYFELTPFGGPEYSTDKDHFSYAEGFLSEFVATFLLALVVFGLNLELHFGKYHYWIKQSLTAIAIRALIEFFPITGPAMNPMLATTWAAFGVGEEFAFPSHPSHYFIYWVGPWCAAVLASTAYVIYAGGTVLGITLPIGPFKKEKVTSTKKKD